MRRLRRTFEQYHEIALGEWLIKAISDPSSKSALAARKIADLFAQQHNDDWWQDFLDHTTRAGLPAIQALQDAITANENDLHYDAIDQSRKAAILFKQQHNQPGTLLARFEEVYALQRILLADDCIEKADQLWTQLIHTNYRWLQGELALEKATCANWVSDFKSVTVNVQTSLRIAAAYHFPELNLRVMGLDAGMKRQQNQYDAAWLEAMDGLRLYWTHSYSFERLYQFYIVMSKCAAEMNHIHASETVLRQSIDIFEQSAPEDNTLKAMLYLRLANLLLGQGNDSRADVDASKAKLLLKSIPADEPTAQKYSVPGRIELAKFELLRGHPTSALSTIESIGSALNTVDNFISMDYYTLLGNIRLRLNQLDEAASAYKKGIHLADQSAIGLEDDAGRLPFVRATDEMYRGLVQVLLAQKQDAKALALWEWSKHRGLNEGTREPDEVPQLPEVAEKHLIYASFTEQLQVWTVQGHTIKSQSIPIKQGDLQRMVRDFAQACGNLNSPPQLLQKQASNLYSVLLEPLKTELAPLQRIVVELDEPISMLTMEALRLPSGHYVGEIYSVVYSPGVLVENTLRQPEPLRTQDTMLLIDASHSDSGAVLPGHQEEVSAVRSTFAKTQVLGPAITAPEVRRALKNSTEFHFSGHGIPDGTGTALAIGSDSSLRARDFSPSDLRHLQLAVLSACSSGLAKRGTFDESNLVRSFLAGGVPTVIASKWDVDSRSTAQFMHSFYDHLRNGDAPATALQSAQAELRAEKGHPYYWAAFTITGRVN